MIIVCRDRELKYAPTLVSAKPRDEVRPTRSSVVAAAEGTKRAASGASDAKRAEVLDARLIVGDLILNRDSERPPLAEVPSIGELVHTCDGTATTDRPSNVLPG